MHDEDVVDTVVAAVELRCRLPIDVDLEAQRELLADLYHGLGGLHTQPRLTVVGVIQLVDELKLHGHLDRKREEVRRR